MSELERVRALATAFRGALERCDRSRLGITFSSFPRGSCGDAALLLGRFLKDHNAGPVVYILGERGEGDSWRSHAWLHVGNIIVDITADQFDDMAERVIVTRSSHWHQTFDAEARGEGDYRIYDAATVGNLGRIYAVVLEQVQTSELG